jgi:hypothetical protein
MISVNPLDSMGFKEETRQGRLELPALCLEGTQ